MSLAPKHLTAPFPCASLKEVTSERLCTKCGVAPTVTQDKRCKYCLACKKFLEKERSARRREDLEYNAKQRTLKAKWKAENREHYLAKHREYGNARYARDSTHVRSLTKAHLERNPQAAENIRVRDRARPNRDERNLSRLESYFAHKYGLDLDDLQKMLQAQAFRCALCGIHNDQAGGRFNCLHVDHDHETGALRQMLCMKCNLAVGVVEKLTVSGMLFEIFEYLKRHTEVKRVA